ncbi:PREDICTED: vascular endothelial growth factor C-like isoform X2 [Branchiostoma belcheri]|uniref:Vascular endothelial growth factor C-like isoform X2 n=1 Tax=Branchiostoma belcheri TaxID=7741 RepID=A0A6P5AZ22_BRABE|nr:PREDICTED: vascular endothelial growth factor C-like isoform X2 [Branchiostoma belcheri]XP_019647401.1 PREDICTED: vascular endothelial growth factor C-like isoform X2 [Branchiostoma belcheri]
MALQSELRLILLLLTCTAIQGEIPFQVLNKLLDVKNPADLFHLFNVSTDSIGPEMSGPSTDFIPDSVLRDDSFPTIAAKDKPIRGRLGGLGGDQGIVLLDDSALGRNPFLSEKVTVSRQGADVVTSLLSEIDFCSPRGMEVKVPNERPSTIVVPSCVNLQRCGGCCHADIFQCEPLEIKNTTITVMKLGLAEGGDLVLEAIEGIEMEEHASCQCGCKVKPHHCNPTIHKYEDCACSCLSPRRDCEEGKVWDEKECQCVCRSGETNCRKRYYWSPDRCECLCADRPCPTGRTLDFNTCKCKRNTSRRLQDSRTPCKRRCPPGALLNRRHCTCSQGQGRGRMLSPFLPFDYGSGDN